MPPPTGRLAVPGGARAAVMTPGDGGGGVSNTDKAAGRDQGPGGLGVWRKRRNQGHGCLPPKSFQHPSCIPSAPEVWKALWGGGLSHSPLSESSCEAWGRRGARIHQGPNARPNYILAGNVLHLPPAPLHQSPRPHHLGVLQRVPGRGVGEGACGGRSQ